MEVSLKVNETAHLKNEQGAVLLGNGCLRKMDTQAIFALKCFIKKFPDSRG